MQQETIDQITEKIKICKDESLLDFILKLLLESGY